MSAARRRIRRMWPHRYNLFYRAVLRRDINELAVADSGPRTGLRVPCPGCEKQALVVALNGGQWYALRCDTPGCPHRGSEVVHHSPAARVP